MSRTGCLGVAARGSQIHGSLLGGQADEVVAGRGRVQSSPIAALDKLSAFAPPASCPAPPLSREHPPPPRAVLPPALPVYFRSPSDFAQHAFASTSRPKYSSLLRLSPTAPLSNSALQRPCRKQTASRQTHLVRPGPDRAARLIAIVRAQQRERSSDTHFSIRGVPLIIRTASSHHPPGTLPAFQSRMRLYFRRRHSRESVQRLAAQTANLRASLVARFGTGPASISVFVFAPFQAVCHPPCTVAFAPSVQAAIDRHRFACARSLTNDLVPFFVAARWPWPMRPDTLCITTYRRHTSQMRRYSRPGTPVTW